jgi:hypothetical protein
LLDDLAILPREVAEVVERRDRLIERLGAEEDGERIGVAFHIEVVQPSCEPGFRRGERPPHDRETGTGGLLASLDGEHAVAKRGDPLLDGTEAGLERVELEEHALRLGGERGVRGTEALRLAVEVSGVAGVRAAGGDEGSGRERPDEAHASQPRTRPGRSHEAAPYTAVKRFAAHIGRTLCGLTRLSQGIARNVVFGLKARFVTGCNVSASAVSIAAL